MAQALEELITAADTVVFCLSPNSAASEVCAWEVETAERLNKRIAPFVIEPVNGKAVPEGLAKLNYILATDPHAFDGAVATLIMAIGTDIAWIREHTRIGQITYRWLARGEPKDELLRGRHLEDAEKWASYHPRDAPLLTAEMGRFLQTSRYEAKVTARRSKRSRALIFTMALGLIGGGGAYLNREFLRAQYHWRVVMKPAVLTAAKESEVAVKVE